MLFKLINTDGVVLSEPDIFCSINNLLTAHRECKHILFSDSDIFETISKSSLFDSLNKNAALMAHNDRRRNHSLFSLISTHVVIDFSNPDIAQKIKNENLIITVGYKYFSDTSSIQPIKLLCEDLSDVDFYTIVADFYKKRNGIRNAGFNVEATNGGGGSIKGNFEKLSNQNKLCFCILDSDKKHPKDKLGSTCSGFKENITTFSSDFYILDAHEVESLIPSSIIGELIQDGIYGQEKFIEFEKLDSMEKEDPDTKIYYDHKEGFTISKLKSLSKYSPEDFWWKVIYNNSRFGQTQCLKNKFCECDSPCSVSIGFGPKLLELSIPSLRVKSAAKIDEMLTPVLRKEWMNVGSRLFSWGCSNSKMIRTS
ncbi:MULTISPECIES: hypothetical protein [Pectobacterium]|uniref:Uncharacterized protein n=1 Tax=Pectobacterium versatile TaxID=2488639 RepID=A0AAW3RVK9_9GAMM|nr:MULTISPECIES: hypothetical protein [Pectobacterium]MBA0160309.1 hypothetical protein [Pectobacterium versatile]POE18521.1 hypothetical protein BV923_21075 [Pectobacterium odoriferum]